MILLVKLTNAYVESKIKFGHHNTDNWKTGSSRLNHKLQKGRNTSRMIQIYFEG